VIGAYNTPPLPDKRKPEKVMLVRAAVRQAAPGLMFAEALKAIIARGRTSEWGNVHPFTAKGIKAAIDHVAFYEMGDLEILMAPFESNAKQPGWTHASALGYPVRPATWLPPKTAVVVPMNREYVGVLTHLSTKHVAMIVHNAGRSLGIVTGA